MRRCLVIYVDRAFLLLRFIFDFHCVHFPLQCSLAGTSCGILRVVYMHLRDNGTPEQQDQAYDRAHRFGQTRDVNIYKLMIPDTVETRILQVSV